MSNVRNSKNAKKLYECTLILGYFKNVQESIKRKNNHKIMHLRLKPKLKWLWLERLLWLCWLRSK